jgi:hypothetical protein
MSEEYVQALDNKYEPFAEMLLQLQIYPHGYESTRTSQAALSNEEITHQIAWGKEWEIGSKLKPFSLKGITCILT